MKAISGKELARLVEKSGWVLARVNGSHHIYCKAGSSPVINTYSRQSTFKDRTAEAPSQTSRNHHKVTVKAVATLKRP
jgi:hypothetical protein